MKTNINELISKRSGLIYDSIKINPKEGFPLLFRYLSVIKYRGEMIRGSGFSLNEDQSKLASIGECIERYCASMDSHLNILKCSRNQSTDFLDLTTITRLTNEQYLINPDFEAKSDHSPLFWIQGTSLLDNTKKWIPYELTLLKKTPYRPIRDIISTGLAAHKSVEQAIIGGLCECIERDAFMLFWLLGRVNFEVSVTEIDDESISALLEIATSSNLSINIYDITTDYTVPTILTLVRRKGKDGFYMGCSSNFSYKKSVIKSLEEGLGGYSIYLESLEHCRKKPPKSFSEIKELEQHPLFYLNGGCDSVLLDLLFRKDLELRPMPKDYFVCLNDVIKTFKYRGEDLFCVDITSADVNSIGFKVVKVIAPTLAFLSIGAPLLNCERLYFFKKYDRDFNLLPHPFP
ncbi:YcaO-like family protein [Paenibacillus thiaminolyticus]|uniref:YcaO-like family protein n=1 Tax=Paenibacillus thiaminolyticus TaxID=49283 RepID=UPI0035A6ABC6